MKKGFSIGKPNLKGSGSNITTNVISHAMTKLNPKPEQEGSGGPDPVVPWYCLVKGEKDH